MFLFGRNLKELSFMTQIRLGRLLIVLITLSIWSNTIWADFMLFDDGVNTYNNPYFKQINLASFTSFWLEPYERLFIPMTYTLWGFVSLISKTLFNGFSPLPYHVANLVVHLFNSVILFHIIVMLVSKYNGRQKQIVLISVFCATLFAVHPIQVEAVAWISGMKDLLSTFFSLCATLLVVNAKTKFENSNPILNTHNGDKENSTLTVEPLQITNNKILTPYFLATLFFVAALLSKPNTVVLPILLTVIISISVKNSFKRVLGYMIPWLVIGSLIAGMAKLFMNPGNTAEYAESLYKRVLIMSDVYVFYIKKILFPHPLLYEYSRKIEDVLNASYSQYLPLIFLSFILVAVLFFKNRKLVISWLFVFTVSLLPYSGLLPFEFQEISIVADRYCYFAMSFFCILLGFFITRYVKFNPKTIIIMCTILIVLSVKTVFQYSLWQNNIILNQYVVFQNDKSYVANFHLGVALFSKGQFSEALEHYKTAFKYAPADEMERVIYNAGITYACMGNKIKSAEMANILDRMGSSRGDSLRESSSKLYQSFESGEGHIKFEFDAGY